MSVPRWLIVRGVRTTDQLQGLGLPMAQSYDNADVVALIGNDNRGLLVKGASETTVVDFVDVESSTSRITAAINRVRREAQADVDPRVNECTVVGMFLFYWPVTFDRVDTVMNAIEQGEAAAVEEAAERFIATRFGVDITALGRLRADEHRSDAAGHAADGDPGAVSGTS